MHRHLNLEVPSPRKIKTQNDFQTLKEITQVNDHSFNLKCSCNLILPTKTLQIFAIMVIINVQ